MFDLCEIGGSTYAMATLEIVYSAVPMALHIVFAKGMMRASHASFGVSCILDICINMHLF